MQYINEYVKYELEKAHKAIKSAELLYDAKDFHGSTNRSYYAAFHALTALLSTDGIFRSKHSGIVSEFRKHYIKTGLLDTNLSDKIGKLKDTRERSDYDTFSVISKSETAQQIEYAKDILNTVECYLERKMSRVESVQQQEQPLRKDLIEQQKQCGGYTPPATPVKQEQPAPELTQKLTPPKKSGQGFGGLKR